ncbi:hypothetical protein F8M41_010260 [Gigaspora margarita]|uniref:Uncharacterized protein n=1 Tax=Gigaspora margarita TaxID=4874 RepID=A0A8H3X3T6_GIGMA|nr:hypothetical protein F8M41_010260 [Gigaspora margarita]
MDKKLKDISDKLSLLHDDTDRLLNILKEVKPKNKSLPYLSMIAEDVKELETYILFIEEATKAAAENVFKNKNKLQNNELKNIYKIFDALSKSQFSFVKEIRDFYKAANRVLTTEAAVAKQQLTKGSNRK